VVLGWSEVPSSEAMNDDKLGGFAEELRLLAGDLSGLKAAAVDRRCRQQLYDIQNATTHQAVVTSLSCISRSVLAHIAVGRGSISDPHCDHLRSTAYSFSKVCYIYIKR
jgi:hypothetical protein